MNSTRARLGLSAAFCLLPLIPLTLRLAQLQVVDHRKLSDIADGEVVRESVEIVPRGRILDRSGLVLAESLPAWSAFMDPTAFREDAAKAGKKASRAQAERIAAALGLEPSEVLAKARPKSRFTWLKRQLTLEESDALRALGDRSVGLVPDERRYHPNADMARSVLGAVGTDGRGLSGLELAFDKALSGQARRVRLLRDGSGKTMPSERREETRTPPDLVLTIDRGIQHYAEEALAAAAAKHDPLWGAVLVQDPRTGELLALAATPPDPLRNPLLQDVYEPGSTYKLITMAAALEEGLTRPDEEIDCKGPWELGPGTYVRDHEPYGVLTAMEMMEKSSNVGLAKLGLRLGAEKFHRWSRAFGFGAKTSLALPGETSGLLKDTAKLTRINLGNNAFGQGLGVTPMQLVGAFTAVANGGTLLEPRLVLSLGKDGATAAEPIKVRRVASAATVQALTRMLEGVVERGTGMAAAVPGYSVAGKTGTSQKLDPMTKKYSKTNYIASFAGWVPAGQPRFTILVIIDSPKHQYYGSEVAAPVFARLARELLALHAVPPDRPLAARPVAEPAPAPATALPAKAALPRPSFR